MAVHLCAETGRTTDKMRLHPGLIELELALSTVDPLLDCE